VRTVRNNLFHGGKSPSRPISEPARDQRLLESSLVVLHECLALNESLCGAFLESA
jgi:hypothetical protein